MAFALSKKYLEMAKQDALTQLVNHRNLMGNKMSAKQREELVRRMREQYSGQQSFASRVQSDKISSVNMNSMFQAAFVDLHVIYSALNSMAGSREYRSRELDSKYNKIRGLVFRLSEEIKRLDIIRQYPEYENVTTFDFNVSSNRSTAFRKAQVTDSGYLRLQNVSKIDFTNDDACSVSVNYLTSGLTSNSGFSPSLMVDNNINSFWCGTVLCDKPITNFPVSLEKDYELNDQSDYTAGGAVISVEVTLDAARWTNNILISTIGKYPVNIIQASYMPEPDSTYREVPGFSAVSQDNNQIELFFEPVPVYKIKLLIEQRNYNRARYNLPTSVISNNVFWQEVLDAESGTGLVDLSEDVSSHMLSNIQAMLEETSYDYSNFETSEGVGKFLEIIESTVAKYSNKIDHISRDILSKYKHSSEYVDIYKIEYNLGIKDIQICSTEYMKTGSWDSKEMINADGILQAEILSTEVHPVIFVNGEYRPATSINYDFDFGRNVVIPVLPKNSVDNNNELIVKSEVLRFDKRNLIANTRFPVDLDKNYSVYADNVKVKTFGIKDNTNYATISISDDEFDQHKTYSITYYPGDRSGYPVSKVRLDELPSKALSSPVVFHNTGDNNTILLPSFPYIEYGVINSSKFFNKPNEYDGVWIYSAAKPTALGMDQNGDLVAASQAQIQSGTYSKYLIDGIHYGNIDSSTSSYYEPIKVTIDGSKAYNITDYIVGQNKIMPETTQLNRKFQFLHWRNKLIFNCAISDANIEVLYSTKAEHIKLKATLFSNTGGSYSFTPSIDDVSVLVRSRFI